MSGRAFLEAQGQEKEQKAMLNVSLCFKPCFKPLNAEFEWKKKVSELG